jgi:ATP-dependent helicase STH1/SNF2
VENELLDKIEQVVRCEMTQTQWLLYDQLLKSKLPFSNPSMQQRKITNHPYLFHPYMRNIAGAYQFPVDETLVQLSGKFSLLDRILPKLKRTGHRVLIFSTMTKVIDVLEMYFQLRNYKSLRFDGGTSSEVRLANVQKFNSDPDVFIMVLSTKAGGLGLNLQSADTVILFDSDWNPQNDMQAMARSHRIGQREQVIILRLITSATIEEKILSTAHEKIDKEAMVIQAGMFNNKYKFNQSRALMKKQLKHKMEEYDDDATSNDDITDILSRSDAERKLFEKMDAQWEREDKEGRSVLPADQMPAWVIHLCTKGKGSNTEQTLAQTEELVEFDRDILEIKEEASADAYIKVSGKRKSRNTDVKYMDADKELDKRVNSYANGRDSSSSEEEEEDTDGEGQVMMDVDEAPKAKSKKKGNGGANKRRKTASSA